jgi:ComF family protein
MFFEKLMTHYSSCISTVLTRLLPPICVLCGTHTHRSQSICLPCQHELPILTENCQKCALFLPAKNRAKGLCDICLTTPRPFRRTYALYAYESPIVDMIVGLKFNQQLSIAALLGELLLEQIQQNWYRHHPLPDVIIPVPLHPYRLRERGYNQALEIARPIAKELGIYLDVTGVTRTRHTAQQSSLDKAARQLNLANAFAACRDYAGMRVAVLDDVITTGTTVTSLCLVLNDRKASSIEVWCCARR